MRPDQEKLDNQLILEERLLLVAYRDTRGFLTVGVGRNLDTNPLTTQEIVVCGSNGRTGPITRDGAILCLHNDEAKVFGVLDTRAQWWQEFNEIRARVMADLCFNMGWRSVDGKHGLSTFHHFLRNMQAGSFDLAADDLRASVWYEEVGTRGQRLVEMVKTGQDYTE